MAQFEPERWLSLSGIIKWYRANYLNLACALKNSKGLKILINVDSLTDFEKYCKKLFLFADTIVIRDVQKRNKDEFELINIPVSSIYDKKYKALEGKKLPPLLVLPPQAGWWTSDKIKFNDGNEIPLAVKFQSYFPSKSYEWMLTNGKPFLETGQIVYAPFIPPMEVELEFLKQGVNMASFYGSQSFFFKEFDWLSNQALTSLLSLKFPTFENIDIKTLNKIKTDNYESFKLFRNDLLDSINQIKSKVGTEDFIKEIKYIQRHKIDDNIDKLNIKMKKIESMRTLRDIGATITLFGVNLVGFLSLSPIHEIAGLTSTLAAGVGEMILRMKEKNELEENPSYFMWKMQNR